MLPRVLRSLTHDWTVPWKSLEDVEVLAFVFIYPSKWHLANTYQLCMNGETFDVTLIN